MNCTCFQYSGCSVVGFDRSTHYRYVQVDKDCLSYKALLHTLFHILGRYHEHERPDREKYVDVIEENIIEGIIVTYTCPCICLYMCIFTPMHVQDIQPVRNEVGRVQVPVPKLQGLKSWSHQFRLMIIAFKPC